MPSPTIDRGPRPSPPQKRAHPPPPVLPCTDGGSVPRPRASQPALAPAGYGASMDPTPDPYDYSTERLLRATARECAELRELLTAVAGDLERLASEYLEHAGRRRAKA